MSVGSRAVGVHEAAGRRNRAAPVPVPRFWAVGIRRVCLVTVHYLVVAVVRRLVTGGVLGRGRRPLDLSVGGGAWLGCWPCSCRPPRFVPAAVGGEVGGAVEHLAALWAPVLEVDDSWAPVLGECEGVFVPRLKCIKNNDRCLMTSKKK